MSTSPLSPLARASSLCLSLPSAASTSPLRAADILDSIRRLLPELPSSHDTSPIALAVVSALRLDPANLLLAHRSVAVLAHPALGGAAAPIEPAVVSAMDRLAMSAAFQHTAMAALQNAATTAPAERDAVVLAVVAAMRHHHEQPGVLLRGADLLAYHLNQTAASPLTSSYRVASRIVVDTSPRLTSTAQGASTALLALVAAARHASSLAAFSGRPSSTTRFSRGGATSTAIVDQQFAAAVVAAMVRHPAHAPVQVLGCEVIRVAAAGATAVAKGAAKELHSAGAASAVLAALQSHATDVTVVDRALVALRSLLLGGGSHGRTIKPSLNVDGDLADYVARVADLASDSIAVKDRDLSSAAAVLAMDVRKASNPSGSSRSARERGLGEGSRLTGFGRKIMRRIRFGQRQNWYDMEYDRFAEEQFTEKGADPPVRAGKDGVTGRGRKVTGRSSFSIMQVSSTYRPSSHDMLKEFVGPAASAKMDSARVNRKMSDGAALGEQAEGAQITLSKKWRSVSGRWNQRGRRGSTVSTGVDTNRMSAAAAVAAGIAGPTARRERRGPLTLSGSEMANLTRQPSRIFGTTVEGHPLRVTPGDPRMTEGRPVFVSAGHEDFGF